MYSHEICHPSLSLSSCPTISNTNMAAVNSFEVGATTVLTEVIMCSDVSILK
jgi:hypothetical protein